MNKNIKIVAILSYDKNIIEDDKESIDWFYNKILKSKKRNELTLHSNEIGDQVGTIKIIKIFKNC